MFGYCGNKIQHIAMIPFEFIQFNHLIPIISSISEKFDMTYFRYDGMMSKTWFIFLIDRVPFQQHCSDEYFIRKYIFKWRWDSVCLNSHRNGNQMILSTSLCILHFAQLATMMMMMMMCCRIYFKQCSNTVQLKWTLKRKLLVQFANSQTRKIHFKNWMFWFDVLYKTKRQKVHKNSSKHLKKTGNSQRTNSQRTNFERKRKQIFHLIFVYRFEVIVNY